MQGTHTLHLTWAGPMEGVRYGLPACIHVYITIYYLILSYMIVCYRQRDSGSGQSRHGPGPVRARPMGPARGLARPM